MNGNMAGKCQQERQTLALPAKLSKKEKHSRLFAHIQYVYEISREAAYDHAIYPIAVQGSDLRQ